MATTTDKKDTKTTVSSIERAAQIKAALGIKTSSSSSSGYSYNGDSSYASSSYGSGNAYDNTTSGTEDVTDEVTVDVKDPNKFYTPNSVDELAAMLKRGGYTPMTAEQMRADGEELYKNQLAAQLLAAQQQYDTDKLAAQQKADAANLANRQGYDSSVLALQQALADNLRQYGQSYDRNVTALNNQIAGINTNADRQLEAQAEANARSISNADRYSLQRGMQRSSYNAANIANLMAQGDKALANIEEDRANNLNAINANLAQLEREYGDNTNAVTTKTNDQIALLQKQLAENLGATDKATADQLEMLAQQLTANQNSANLGYEQSVIERIRELQDQDYARQQTEVDRNNQLAMQLYELRLKENQYGSSGGYGGGYSSGGYGGYSSYGKSSSTDTTNNPTNKPTTQAPNSDRQYGEANFSVIPPQGSTAVNPNLGNLLNSNATKIVESSLKNTTALDKYKTMNNTNAINASKILGSLKK